MFQQPQASGAAPAPGWYDDPSGSGQLRWWDGTQWTSATNPKSGLPPVQPPSNFQPVPAPPQGTYDQPAPAGGYAGAPVPAPAPAQAAVEMPLPGPGAQTNPSYAHKEPVPGPSHHDDTPVSRPTGIKALIAKARAFSNTKFFVITSQILTFVLALISMILVIKAFNQLDEATNDVGNMVTSWKTQPVVAFETVTPTASCSTGFERYPQTTWPGAEAGPCLCDVNAHTSNGPLETHSGSCNSTERAAGCRTDPSIGSIVLDEWRTNMKVCIKREGAPAYDASSETRRPSLLTDTASCPTGYKRCGAGNYTDGAMCQLSNAACPIQVALVDNSSPGAEYTSVPFALQRPLVDLTNGYGEPGSDLCFGHDVGRHYSGRSGETSGFRHEGSCDEDDPRYTVLDSITEAAYVTANFEDNPDWCGTTRDESAIPGFSILCGSNTLCNNNWPVTRCQKLTKYSASAGTTPWSMLQRQEMEWDVDCETSMEDIVDHKDPLEEARDLQRIVMAINITSFVLVGLIIPIAVIWNKCGGDVPCCPGEGKGEAYAIKILNKGVGICAKIAKLIAVALSIALLNRLRHFFSDAAAGDCSDDFTNANFDYLGSELEDVYRTNVAALAIDTLQVFFAVVMILFTMRSAKKSGVTIGGNS